MSGGDSLERRSAHARVHADSLVSVSLMDGDSYDDYFRPWRNEARAIVEALVGPAEEVLVAAAAADPRLELIPVPRGRRSWPGGSKMMTVERDVPGGGDGMRLCVTFGLRPGAPAESVKSVVAALERVVESVLVSPPEPVDREHTPPPNRGTFELQNALVHTWISFSDDVAEDPEAFSLLLLPLMTKFQETASAVIAETALLHTDLVLVPYRDGMPVMILDDDRPPTVPAGSAAAFQAQGYFYPAALEGGLSRYAMNVAFARVPSRESRRALAQAIEAAYQSLVEPLRRAK